MIQWIKKIRLQVLQPVHLHSIYLETAATMNVCKNFTKSIYTYSSLLSFHILLCEDLLRCKWEAIPRDRFFVALNSGLVSDCTLLANYKFVAFSCSSYPLADARRQVPVDDSLLFGQGVKDLKMSLQQHDHCYND